MARMNIFLWPSWYLSKVVGSLWAESVSLPGLQRGWDSLAEDELIPWKSRVEAEQKCEFC